MALETTSSGTNASAIANKYYIKQLLKYAKPLLVLTQAATVKHLPANVASLTVRFMKLNAPAVAGIVTPTEGVYAATNRALQLTYTDVLIAQRFQDCRVSDVLLAEHPVAILDAAIGLLKDDFLLDVDTNLRNQWVADNIAAASATYKRYAGGAANFAALTALSQSAGAIVVKDLLDARTVLMVGRAPTWDGKYLGFVPTQCIRDLMADTTFVNASSYSNIKALYNGEFGEYYGVRCIEHTNAFRETSGGAEGTQSAAGVGIYTTIVAGQQAVGMADLFNQPALSPKLFILDKPDKVDPANQFVTVATKYMAGYKQLDNTFSCHIRAKSSVAGL